MGQVLGFEKQSSTHVTARTLRTSKQAASHGPSIESILDEQYEILRVLAHGSSATVYLAKERTTGRRVAIKALSRNKYNDELSKNEVQRCLALRGPYVVALYDFLIGQRKWYLIFEYLEGGDLFSHIEPERGYKDSEQELLRAFRSLAEGVAFMHDRDLIHRDIKSENIGVDSEGRLKFLDLGFCTDIASAHHCLGKGTRSYLCPEAFVSDSPLASATKAADIWALGIVFFTLISGMFPWPEATRHHHGFVRFSKGDTDFEPWRSMSTNMRTLLFKMLHLKAHCRITAKQLVAELADADAVVSLDEGYGSVTSSESVLYRNDCPDECSSSDDVTHLKM
eukprot:Colp12_sorted_trinity150504_noHs@34372